VREVHPIGASGACSRALSPRGRAALLKQMNADESARRRDLPHQVFFMLATGARIGEALAVVWSDVDLDAGTVELSSTLIRMKGGVVAKADQDAQR